MTHPGNTSGRIPNHRWVAQEARWIFADEREAWVRGLMKTQAGDLLISCYRGGKDQMDGEEILYRSLDQGLSWQEATNFTKSLGMESLTSSWQTLRSGRILAVVQSVGTGGFREAGPLYSHGPPGRKPQPARVYEYAKRVQTRIRTLYSDDDGHTWNITDFAGLPGAFEHRCGEGRIAEMPDGTLVLPGHTFTNEEDEKAWIFSPCILRSTDQGKSWGDPSVIANGERDLGNCYNESDVVRLADGRWMAFFRMNPTHYGRSIPGYRCFSSDEGRTWSLPEQCLAVSGEMDMLLLPDNGLMVTAKGLSGRLTVSYDDGRSWAYQGYIYKAWYDPEGEGKKWRGCSWFNHVIQLDEETLLAVHSPWHGERIIGARARWIHKVKTPAVDESRSVFTSVDSPAHRWVIREARPVYRGEEKSTNPQICRTGNGELLVSVQLGTSPGKTVVLRSTDRGLSWGQALEVFSPSSFTAGGGYGLTRLRSGRLVMACGEHATSPGTGEPAGETKPGIPRYQIKGFEKRSILRLAISDHHGHRWRMTPIIDCAPFVGAVVAGRLVELPTGDLLMPIYGALSQEDISQTLDSCGLLRSQDGGQTWLTPTVIAAADQSNGRSFRKTSVHGLADGNLRAAIETLYPLRGPDWEEMISFSASNDVGKTWSPPLETFPGYDPMLDRLPDESVFLAHALWNGIEFEVSHNEAITWVYQDKLYNNAKDRWRACPAGSAALVTLNEETALAVYHLPDGNGIDATWIRSVPRDSKEARERFE